MEMFFDFLFLAAAHRLVAACLLAPLGRRRFLAGQLLPGRRLHGGFGCFHSGVARRAARAPGRAGVQLCCYLLHFHFRGMQLC